MAKAGMVFYYTCPSVKTDGKAVKTDDYDEWLKPVWYIITLVRQLKLTAKQLRLTAKQLRLTAKQLRLTAKQLKLTDKQLTLTCKAVIVRRRSCFDMEAVPG